jgi:hypothetical protein
MIGGNDRRVAQSRRAATANETLEATEQADLELKKGAGPSSARTNGQALGKPALSSRRGLARSPFPPIAEYAFMSDCDVNAP